MSISAIKNFASETYQTLPSVGNVARALTTEKTAKIVLLSLGVLALDAVPKATAGPITEVVCMAACTAAAFTPWGALAWGQCMSVCALLGFAPTP